MQTYQTFAKVGKNGELTLNALPFAEGAQVKITVREVETDSRPWPPEFPLRGSVIKYDDPFGPACPPEEWEAVKEALG